MDIEDLAPEVCPAGDLGDPAAGVKLVVTGIGVSLQEPGVAGQMLLWMSAGAVGGELVPDQRRCRGARGAIINGIDLEPAGGGAAAAGIKHRHRGIVGVEIGGRQPLFADAGNNWIEQLCGLAGPACQGRSVDIDALGGHHLGLAIERQMVIELGDDDMRQGCKCCLAVRDGLHRRRRLDDGLAGAAAVLGPDVANGAPADRHDVEHLVGVGAEGPQDTAAGRARTGAGDRFMDNLEAWQVRG